MKRGVSLQSLLAHKIAVDFGSSNIVIAIYGIGVVIDAPAVVAQRGSAGEVIAVGEEAEQMIGRTSDDISIVRPVVDGSVADFEAFEFLLRHYLEQIHSQHRVLWQRPEIALSVVSTASEVEKRAIVEAARNTGARSVQLVSKGTAAAVGSLKGEFNESSSLCIDMGGGTTELTIVDQGELIATASIKQASEDITKAVTKLCRTKYGVRIGQSDSRRIKHTIGNVVAHDAVRSERVVGLEGSRKSISRVSVESDVLTFPLQKSLSPIVALIKETIDSVDSDLAQQIASTGLILSGGGVKLKGMDRFLKNKFGYKTHVVKQPRHATIRGLLELFARPELAELVAQKV